MLLKHSNRITSIGPLNTSMQLYNMQLCTNRNNILLTQYTRCTKNGQVYMGIGHVKKIISIWYQ